MLDFLEPVWLPQTLAAVLMVLLAAWLLVVDFNKTAHRVFAAILFFRSLNILLTLMRAQAATTNVESALLFHRLFPYALLPIVPLTAYFLCVYPRPRGWIGTSRWGAPAVFAFIAATWVAYALDHSLLWTEAAGPRTGFAASFQGYHYTAFGPLVIVTSLWTVAFSVASVFFALDYLNTSNRSPRFSALLVYAGFALNSLWDGSLRIVQVLRGAGADPQYPWWPFGWALVVLPALTILPVLLSMYILYSRRRIHPDVTRDVNRFFAVAPLAIASGLGLGFFGSMRELFLVGPGSFAHFLMGVWRLSLPVLVSYALLRYDLFDIDHKVKAAVKHGTLIGAPVSVFFAVSEITEGLIQNQVGMIYGAIAAIAISIAFKPLERFAHRVAAHVFPRLKAFDALTPQERVALFEEQLRLAQQDGNISPKEQRMLDLLSERLGLPRDPIAHRMARRNAAYS
jgi:hypothetical protein